MLTSGRRWGTDCGEPSAGWLCATLRQAAGDMATGYRRQGGGVKEAMEPTAFHSLAHRGPESSVGLSRGEAAERGEEAAGQGRGSDDRVDRARGYVFFACRGKFRPLRVVRQC